MFAVRHRYTASKFALAGFTDAMRAELAGSGVFVGQVHPGVIKSKFLERAQWFGAEGAKSQQLMGNMLGQPAAKQGPAAGGAQPPQDGAASTAMTSEALMATASSATGFVQTPKEVAQAVVDMITNQKTNEVVVGPVFNAAINGYRLTGFNPFDLA